VALKKEPNEKKAHRKGQIQTAGCADKNCPSRIRHAKAGRSPESRAAIRKATGPTAEQASALKKRKGGVGTGERVPSGDWGKGALRRSQDGTSRNTVDKIVQRGKRSGTVWQGHNGARIPYKRASATRTPIKDNAEASLSGEKNLQTHVTVNKEGSPGTAKRTKRPSSTLYS